MKSQKNLKKVFLMTLLVASALGVSSCAYAARERIGGTRLAQEGTEETQGSEEAQKGEAQLTNKDRTRSVEQPEEGEPGEHKE